MIPCNTELEVIIKKALAINPQILRLIHTRAQLSHATSVFNLPKQ